MAYQELGKARILKRYHHDGTLEPVRKSVCNPQNQGQWLSVADASRLFLNGMNRSCVTPSRRAEGAN